MMNVSTIPALVFGGHLNQGGGIILHWYVNGWLP